MYASKLSNNLQGARDGKFNEILPCSIDYNFIEINGVFIDSGLNWMYKGNQKYSKCPEPGILFLDNYKQELVTKYVRRIEANGSLRIRIQGTGEYSLVLFTEDGSTPKNTYGKETAQNRVEKFINRDTCLKFCCANLGFIDSEIFTFWIRI
jgi:hypothetical protein